MESKDPLKIMPLGNSVTQADRDNPSYRYYLWNLLKENGYYVDFVGSLHQNFMGDNPVKDFDHDHEGHWGWRADQIVDGIEGIGKLDDFMKEYTPEVVLMHLGSNDIFQGEPIDQVIDDLQAVIRVLISHNPQVIIIIAQIIPVVNAHINNKIDLLNSAIARLPARLNLAPQLIVVDQNSGFNPYSDTYDGIHPNTRGERKMAQKWYDTIKDVVKR